MSLDSRLPVFDGKINPPGGMIPAGLIIDYFLGLGVGVAFAGQPLAPPQECSAVVEATGVPGCATVFAAMAEDPAASPARAAVARRWVVFMVWMWWVFVWMVKGGCSTSLADE
jgi:hypothetical protein